MKMKKNMKLVVLTLAVALVFGGSWLLASEEIAKAENARCTACHDKPGSKLLTDKGKYFETVRSLEGFNELEAEFGRCTHCHVRKPGSDKLTREGKKLAEVVNDMTELKAWLEKKHPKSEADGEAEKKDE
jgi:hypothetical protein